MSALFDPQEEAKVDMLLEVTGNSVTREEATNTLRFFNGSLEQATDRLVFGGDTQPEVGPRWDPSLHSADRYGNQDTINGLPSFNIHMPPGVDNYPHSSAPTRPPSRVSQRSDMHPDRPLQSVEGEPMHGPANQASSAQLRLATQPHYEAQSWALTRVVETTAPDCPPPSSRIRPELAPAFLKPFSNNSPLPALITIMHSIPQCRNIFLASKYRHSNYSVSGDWWNADPSTISDSYKSYRNEHLVREMQRLTTFFDRSQRAYGSAGTLQNLGGWQHDNEIHNVRHSFPAMMDAAYDEHGCPTLGSVLKSEWQGEGEVPSTDRYDLTTVDAADVPWEDLSLYDVIDATLFDPNKGSSLLLIPASVQVIQLKNSNAARPVQVPPCLYLGRYGVDKREMAKSMIEQYWQYMVTGDEAVKELEEIKYQTKNGKRYEALKCMETAMRAFQPDSDGKFANPKHEETLEKLQKTHAFVEKHIQEKEERRDRIIQEFRNMRAKNRVRLGLYEYENGPRYSLVGFTAGPDTYYRYQSYGPGSGQWWNFTWVPGSGCIVQAEPNVETVLDKAGRGPDNLLVYAADAALAEILDQIPKELEDFIDEDNARFQQELSEAPASSWQHLPEETIEPFGGWNEEPTYSNVATDSEMPWDAPSGYDLSAVKQGYYPQNEEEYASSRTLTPNTEMGGDMQEVGVTLSKETQATVSAYLKNRGWQSRSNENAAVSADVNMEDRPEAQHIENVDAKQGDGDEAENGGKDAPKYGSNNPYKPIVERDRLL